MTDAERSLMNLVTFLRQNDIEIYPLRNQHRLRVYLTDEVGSSAEYVEVPFLTKNSGLVGTIDEIKTGEKNGTDTS